MDLSYTKMKRHQIIEHRDQPKKRAKSWRIISVGIFSVCVFLNLMHLLHQTISRHTFLISKTSDLESKTGRASLREMILHPPPCSEKKCIYLDLGGHHPKTSYTEFVKSYPNFHSFDQYHIWEANPEFHPHWNHMKHVVLHKEAVGIQSRDEVFLFRGQTGKLVSYSRSGRHHKNATVHVIDFSIWLEQNIQWTDYCVLKIDIEGTEFELIRHLIHQETIYLIDELFVEQHELDQSDRKWMNQLNLVAMLRYLGIRAHGWH